MQEQNENIKTQIEEIKPMVEHPIISIRKEPTINEKIDFIYRTLKTQQRNYRIKLWIKLIIFLWFLYLIFLYIPQMTQHKIDELKGNISTVISEQVSSFAKPIIKDLTQDLMGEQTETIKQKAVDMKEKMFNSNK